jgi:aminoglycoside phosphotransferase (APT) family kinase protein
MAVDVVLAVDRGRFAKDVSSITPGDVVARGTRSTIRAHGRGAVVKVPDPTTPDCWIEFEAEYAQAARTGGAPVPRLLGMERVAGRVASVWEHVPGESMWQLIVDTPARSAELGTLLGDVHEALFKLVPPVTLPSQRDRLAAKIRRAAATIDPAFADALGLLPAVRGGARLCHGDLHPSNVVMSPNGPVIVDWFDSSRGDPVGDVARSSLILLADGAHPPRHLPGAGPATLERLTTAYLARMREHRDVSDDLLGRWQVLNAVARMAEGVPPGRLLEVWRRFQEGSGPPSAAS